MTRFRDLPGGVDRASYCWPHVSCLHPEHGVYEMDVHCVRDPHSGSMCLLAFLAHTEPNSTERTRQIDMVAEVADGLGNVIEPIEDTDISRDIAIRLAGEFHAKPGRQIVVMQVGRS